MGHEEIPKDLLERCLATIPGAATAGSFGKLRFRRWAARALGAAAAAIAIAAVGLLARPRDAAAAHFLQAVQTTWTQVPACHRLTVMSGPILTRTEEGWYVRGKAGRLEVRSDNTLKGVVVSNGRWEFHWDVPGKLVAAWSTTLLDKHGSMEHAGLVLEGRAILQWAEGHRAEIRDEPDTLDGRKVRKVVLRWPGPGGPKSHPQTDTIWFDPDSHRPVRQRSESWEGQVIDARIDYPRPEDVPADLLAFRPPRDVTLEINDPDLGRQVYSEAAGIPADPPSAKSKGAER
jgi:hypothetical protein